MGGEMKCKECGGSDFELTSGFYYCNNCGTQGEDQQVEYDHNFGLEGNFQHTTKIKTVNKEIANRLTSWEEYNYILLGLVNELIDLGAKDELKMTALQMWATYLRVNEVAFFSRRDAKIPKLGASFKSIDADIIYNLKIKKKRAHRSGNSSDGKSSMVSGYSKRSFRRQQQTLARSELEALQKQNELNASMTILNQSSVGTTSDGTSSISSTVSQQPVRLEFSRISRRVLKKTICKRHLHKHEEDGTLACHRFQRKNYLRSYTPEVVSRSMMYEILYLALNQIEDDIQMGDIIRYIREGRLTYTNVVKFFPENVKKQKHQNNFKLSHSVFPSHSYFRFAADRQRQLLHVDMKLPNLSRLTKRYIDELCLPSEVHTMIETLLLVCPPEMTVQKTATFKMPNYEGRAMAFILFAVKLLFGLDDERERKISASAQQINEKLYEVQCDRKKLFVWSKWTEFIEMRNVILSQCHFPTESSVVDQDAQKNTHLYLDFLRQQQLQHMEEDDEFTKKHTALINFETIFQKATEMHEHIPTFLNFDKSLTPKRSYLERLLHDGDNPTNIFIPKYMHDDHSEFGIASFLNPADLRSHLNKLGVSLRIKRVPCNERVQFNRVFMRYFPETSNAYASGFKVYNYEHDVNPEDWTVQNQIEQITKEDALNMERDDQTTIIKQHLTIKQKQHAEQNQYKKLEQKNESVKTIVSSLDDEPDETNDDVQSLMSSILASVRSQFQPAQEERNAKRKLIETATLFDCIGDADEQDMSDDDGNETFDFMVNSYEYWTCMGYQNDMRKPAFECLLKQLPQSFCWMLRQCAETINCGERDLFRELQIVENQYSYVLESFGKMTNTVLYSNATNKKRVPGLHRLSNSLRRYW